MIAALIPVLGTLLDRILPDPKVAADAKLEMLKLAQAGEFKQLDADVQLATGQMDINKVEAASENVWKSGWRPGAGWICVAGLAYQVLFRPIFGWIAMNLWHWSAPPTLEIDTLMTLLFGMLGLGAYRTVERVKKAS